MPMKGVKSSARKKMKKHKVSGEVAPVQEMIRFFVHVHVIKRPQKSQINLRGKKYQRTMKKHPIPGQRCDDAQAL